MNKIDRGGRGSAGFHIYYSEIDMTQCQDEVRTYSAGTHILKVVKWG